MGRLFLIRHGRTKGNDEKRYIGSTDEPLSEEGRLLLHERKTQGDYPKVDKVYCSPMKRALQTAGIIYPDMEPVVMESLKERDFGIYEGCNHEDLVEDKAYNEWLESGGALPFPGGEEDGAFCGRIEKAFDEIRRLAQGEDAAVITHGGVIMSYRAILQGDDNIYNYMVSCGDCIDLGEL